MKKYVILLLVGELLLSACSQNNAVSSSAPQTSSVSQTSSSAVSSGSSEPEPVPEPEPEPEPDNNWQFDSPENHAMDPDVLEDLHAALPGSGIHSVVTVKDGVIIDEYYEESYDEESLFEIYSASKSVTSALIGIAIDEGYIGSVEDPVSQYLPQILEQEDSRKHGLTLRHLLTHTSGLEWYEWGGGYSNWGEFRTAENWVDYILGRNLLYEPGTVFNYSTGNTHLLSAVLQAATGMSQEEYCREKLFDPMGISELAHWRTDGQGIADGGNGLFISARDAAKFGQLFLDEGVWKGEQLVPASWVEESTTAKNNGAGDGTGSYGYQWWMRSFDVGGYGTYQPPHGQGRYTAYYAFGHAGQFIYVIPEMNMVVVFTSDCQSSYAPRPYFADYLLAAYMG